METTNNYIETRQYRETNPTGANLWTAARYTALAVAIAVVVGLFARPEIYLIALLDVIVPLIPAALLLNPLIWRNVCPLATANMLPNGAAKRHKPDQREVRKMQILGMVLFMVLVPARRFLFNENAVVLAGIIVALIVVGAALGSYYDMKSGFCNSFCPVLPVERLYGSSPLIKVSNVRCFPRCTGCAPACIDLGPERAPRQALGNGNNGRLWAFTPFGMFVLAFPGFVLGYNSITDVVLNEAFMVYGRLYAYSAASLLLFGGLSVLFKISFNRLLPILSALAASVYYWYAAPTMMEAFRLGEQAGNILRVAIFALIGIWFVVAFRRSGPWVAHPHAA